MVIAVVDDLLFSSKIRGVASKAGTAVTFVRDRAAIVDAIRKNSPSLVIFDLDRDSLDPVGAIEEIRATDEIKDVRIVGFVSHVRADRIAAARAAGATQVLARSAFVSTLDTLLT
jgi:CheY-like chemotaxis protein